MRISESEKKQLVGAVLKYFGENADVWLFGSRADDLKKGGDIDVYIETDEMEQLVMKRIQLKLKLRDLFGDQKIDVVVHQRNLPLQPIHEIARSTGVRLN